MDGKWWGGYYGWRWPHGAWIMLESSLIAGCNATLLTGDDSWLDLHRSQADLIWSLRKEQDNKTVVPFRHGDGGWFDYRPARSRHYAHLYFMSRSAEDWARIEERFPERSAWYAERPRLGKAGHFWPERWLGYIAGENPDFPDQVLDDTYAGICQRMDKIDSDNWDELDSWDVHHWQDLNPVVPEGLAQMTMGTPAAVYHGGLLHASVRYFDPCYRRPGLPEHVAALVEAVTPQGIRLTLVNTDPLQCREVLVQGGAFGEHRFTEARLHDQEDGEAVPVNDRYLCVRLGPSAQAHLEIDVQRFASLPTYEFPSFEV